MQYFTFYNVFQKENNDLFCLDTSLAINQFKNTWHEKNPKTIQ